MRLRIVVVEYFSNIFGAGLEIFGYPDISIDILIFIRKS